MIKKIIVLFCLLACNLTAQIIVDPDRASNFSVGGGGGSAPSYVGNGGLHVGSGDSIEVDYPASISANDLLIVSLTHGYASNEAIFDSIPGWYNGLHVDETLACATQFKWKRAIGSESGSVMFARNTYTSGGFYGVMTNWSGVVTTGTPYEDLDSWNTAGTDNATFTVPSCSTLGTNRLVVAMIHVEDDFTIGTVSGGSYTEHFEVSTATGTDCAFAHDSQEVATSSLIASQTSTLSAAGWGVVYVMALKPTE